MLLCYITDRRQFPGNEADRRHRLLEKIAQASRAGVDLIQLRERDLWARDLEALAREAVRTVRENPVCSGSSQGNALSSFRRAAARILINSRLDIALASGADGVHLRSDDIAPADVRSVWQPLETGNRKLETAVRCMLSVSCHSASELRRAKQEGADIALFAPVFEKAGTPGVGLAALRDACQAAGGMPVLALGGVTAENARACLEAGAAGIAAIRLFQENDAAEVVAALRRLRVPS